MGKILIAGGTGFIGKQLSAYLLDKGYSLNVLTRKYLADSLDGIQYFHWDINKSFIDKMAFEEVDTIINLTGANIGEKRWTTQRKKEILDSRIDSIELLYQYVTEYKIPISTFVSSSATGFYGAVTTEKVYDETSENATDFLGTVCKKWEETALRFNTIGARTVILRKGVIIGPNGGMYQKLAPLAKLGINISLGNGNQYLPWIDIRDLVKLYDFVLANKQVNGIYNVIASEQITMNDFSKALLRSFGKKSILPNVPRGLIRLFFGEMAEMLLEGSKVCNEKMKNTGFMIEFDTIKKSLHHSL